MGLPVGRVSIPPVEFGRSRWQGGKESVQTKDEKVLREKISLQNQNVLRSLADW
jgi:hypothetical protein